MIHVPPIVVPPEHRPTIDTATVAQLTGESEATVRRRCAAGQYPHSRFGRALRFSRADVAAILAAGRQGDASGASPHPLYDNVLAETAL